MKKIYRPKQKEKQKLRLAIQRFAATPDFDELPEEFKTILNGAKK